MYIYRYISLLGMIPLTIIPMFGHSEVTNSLARWLSLEFHGGLGNPSHVHLDASGCWLTYPSEQWWSSSMGRMTSHIWKIQNVWNHQPGIEMGQSWKNIKLNEAVSHLGMFDYKRAMTTVSTFSSNVVFLSSLRFCRSPICDRAHKNESYLSHRWFLAAWSLLKHKLVLQVRQHAQHPWTEHLYRQDLKDPVSIDVLLLESCAISYITWLKQ